MSRSSVLRALVLVHLAGACGDSGSASGGASASSSGSGGAAASTDSETPTTSGTTSGATGTGDAGSGSTAGAGTTIDATSDPGTSGSTTSVATDAGSTTEPASTGEDGTSTGVVPCGAGEIVCDGQIAKTCDGAGGFSAEEQCAAVCVDAVGCKLCAPGTSRCDKDTVVLCDPGGDSESPVETCDPVQGLACDPDAGACVGPCASAGDATLGCEFYPTVTSTEDSAIFADIRFGVAVVNPGADPVKVTITRADAIVHEGPVGAGAVAVLELPWVPELYKGYLASVRVTDGAYRLRSDGPVAVYQYSPLQAVNVAEASLLLPVRLWTGNYAVASFRQWTTGFPGFYAVTAAHNGTTVTLAPSATGKPVAAGGGVAEDGTGAVQLDAGDVLQVISLYNTASDLTGTRIVADRPVQVIGGHKCTQVPQGVQACEHLEEAMIPIERLAETYVVGPPAQVPTIDLDKPQFVRVIAVEDDTTLVFDPDQPVAKMLSKAGDFVQLDSTTARFVVSADKKLVVAQYMIGNGAGFGASDPAMLMAAAPGQWRADYLLHAPPAWPTSYLDLFAAAGAKVSVDGQLVAGWQAIGGSGYAHSRVELVDTVDGLHTVHSDSGVGAAISGLKPSGCYWLRADQNLPVAP